MSNSNTSFDSQICGAGLLFIPSRNDAIFVSPTTDFIPIAPKMNSMNSLLTHKSSNNDTPVLVNLSDLKTSTNTRKSLMHTDMCKAALETKLRNRPSKIQLIQRGILPPANTPPKFLKQRTRLERAKMCDILKHKIEDRPEKKQLISKHILLADSQADPIIQERAVQLKRCKLADSLNDKLAHRPGPLELVQENILHVDDVLQQAVKDGRLPFKPTSAGLVQKHPDPVLVLQQDGTLQYSNNIDDSTVMLANLDMTCGDPGAFFQYERGVSAPATPAPAPTGCTSTTPPMIGTNSGSFLPTGGGKASKSKFKRPKSAACKSVTSASQPYGPVPSPPQPSATVKSVPSKIIRFHEYKGPQTPNGSAMLNSPAQLAQFGNSMINMSTQAIPVETNAARMFSESCTNSPASNAGSPQAPADSKETSYELLLQQQQLFLQWQLELKQKYPNSVIQLMPISAAAAAVAQQNNQQMQQSIPVAVPADTSTGSSQLQSMDQGVFMQTNCDPCMDTCHAASEESVTSKQTAQPAVTTTVSTTTTKSSQPLLNVNKLEDLRVADLKAECKKRNLPVSGPKPALLDRMRPYEDVIVASFQKPPDADSTTCTDDPNAVPTATTNANDVSSSQTKQPSAVPNLAPPPISGLVPSSLNGSLLLQPSPSASDLRSVSSDTSGIASNYSSPGIDLSSLSFSQGQTASGVSNSGSVSCFTFASQGSGGQFTLANPNSSAAVPSAACTAAQVCGSTSSIAAFSISAPPVQAVQTPLVSSPLCAVTSSSAPLVMTSSAITNDAMAPSTTSATPPATLNLLTALNPLNGSNAQNMTPEHSTRIDGLTLTAMSATTLSLHEEMLRHQQKKIEELQKELQRSQEQLKHQQQVILQARKAQSERANGLTAPTDGKSPVEQAAEAWLAQIDTKHLQKFHIQLFLQHKLQQQQLQQQMAMQQELVATQTRLREELGVQQAVNEVGTLVRSEPRAAMLILQLLKRLQGQDLNTLPIANLLQQNNNAGINDLPTAAAPQTLSNQPVASTSGCESVPPSTTPVDTKPIVNKKKSKSKSATAAALPVSSSMQGLLAPCPVNCMPPTTPATSDYGSNNGDECKQRHNSGNSNAQKKAAARSNSLPLAGCKSSNVDMEEIFRTVMDLASQKLANAQAEQMEKVDSTVDCTGDASAQQRLPSCDQLIPPLRSCDESSDVGHCESVSEGACSMMQQILLPPAAVPANQPTLSNQQLVYTRNDAFDDLMEVLRDNADYNALQLGHDLDVTQSILGQGQGYPNTFGSHQLTDVLGSDWLETAAAAANAAQNCMLHNVEPQGTTVKTSNGQMQGREATEAINSYVQALHEQEVQTNSLLVSHNPHDQLQNSVTADFDFRNTFEQSGDQMDWLDLILPSPGSGNLELPNPSGLSGLSVPSNTMHMDVFHSANSAKPMTSCNPVLTQSSIQTDFDLTA